MYYIYGVSGPSLLIESTDSMINMEENHKNVSYQSLPNKGPWAVYLTLGSNWGWADIAGISIKHYKVHKVVQIMHDIIG